MLLPLLLNLRMFEPKWTHGEEESKKARRAYAIANREKTASSNKAVLEIWQSGASNPAYRSIEFMTREEITDEISLLMKKRLLNDNDEAMLLIMLAALS